MTLFKKQAPEEIRYSINNKTLKRYIPVKSRHVFSARNVQLDEYIERIRNAESLEVYEKTVSDLSDYLYKHGKANESAALIETAGLRKNRFSKREMKAEFSEKKAAVIKYCSMLTERVHRDSENMILTIL